VNNDYEPQASSYDIQTTGMDSGYVGQTQSRTPARVEAPPTDSQSRKVKYIRSLQQVEGLSEEAKKALEEVSKRYVFRANDYYLSLIDWNDPEDPIRRLVIPTTGEMTEWGKLDASNEAAVTVAQGVQHKYRDTALVLVNNVCGAYCRYCFRKRLFMNDHDEAVHELEPAFAYIASHSEITDVLLTGGDPLIMSTGKLRPILERLAAIPHVRTIRTGSKMLAFNPFRLLDDPELQRLIREIATPERALYIMAHFDHPRELTAEAREAVTCAMRSGARVVNQCPMIRGINDKPETLAALFNTMTNLGAPQYYVFQCRPTAGNEPFDIPIVESWRIFSQAQELSSGLSRRARFCMSHATGKVEVIGVDTDFIYTRYHRAKDEENVGRVMIFHRDDRAIWLDQLKPAAFSGRSESAETETNSRSGAATAAYGGSL
jgi:lysine 2,3-aminomutase